jgi:hypothetical protein
MSELKSFPQPPPPDVEVNPAACRCHTDAQGGEAQETEGCRCHRMLAKPQDAPTVATPFAASEGGRLSASAWQPGFDPVPSECVGPVAFPPVSRLRTVLGVVFLVPLLALGVGMLVSGFLPAVVAGLALFLPALIPLALVGLGILLTSDLHARGEEQGARHRSAAWREAPSQPTGVL